MTITQWFRHHDPDTTAWDTRAACKHPILRGLPWTPDEKPGDAQLEQMQRVCREECPVLRGCAAFALKSGAGEQGVEGGFYAGIWIPWRRLQPTADHTAARQRARLALKHLLQSLPVIGDGVSRGG